VNVRCVWLSTIAFVLLASSGCDLCGNEELSRIPSPDGKLHAVVLLRACGATTGFSTQVSLVDAGQEAQGAGTLFIGDCRGCDWDRDRPFVEATWSDSHHLTITADRNARVSRATSEDRGGLGDHRPCRANPLKRIGSSSGHVLAFHSGPDHAERVEHLPADPDTTPIRHRRSRCSARSERVGSAAAVLSV
jgi:hypothetical protein